MEQEHTACDDSMRAFTTTNGVTTTSATEWEAALAPQTGHAYPDRFPPGDARCRTPQPLEALLPAMEERNAQLAAIGQSLMVADELAAARLYSGPMYQKYNLVLRSFSGVAFLREQFERDCKGNLYATTIHGINSCVIKLSKLQIACYVYRGSIKAVLPPQFWESDEYGLSGGVEFGFTSTTVHRAQAMHYAQGQASLIFESRMGLTDRGADLSWLSQCDAPAKSAPRRPHPNGHPSPSMLLPSQAADVPSRAHTGTRMRGRYYLGRCWGSSRSPRASRAARSWCRRACRST